MNLIFSEKLLSVWNEEIMRIRGKKGKRLIIYRDKKQVTLKLAGPGFTF